MNRSETQESFEAATVAVFYGFCDGRWDRTERLLRAMHVVEEGGAMGALGTWERDRLPVLLGVLRSDPDRYFRIRREQSFACATLNFWRLDGRAEWAAAPMTDWDIQEEAADRAVLGLNDSDWVDGSHEPDDVPLMRRLAAEAAAREEKGEGWDEPVPQCTPTRSMGWIDECLAWGVCHGENVDAVLAVLAGESTRSVGLRFGLNHLVAARKAKRVRKLRRGLSAELPDLFTI